MTLCLNNPIQQQSIPCLNFATLQVDKNKNKLALNPN